MNKQELIETLEGWKTLRGKKRQETVYYQLAEVIELAEQLNEPRQPVVPICAELWLEQAQCSTDVIDLFSEVEYATDSDGFISKHWRWSPGFYEWLCGDADTLYLLCDALRCGYEVKKELLYRVKLGEGYFVEYRGSRKKGVLIVIDGDEEIKIFDSKKDAEYTAQAIGGTVEEVAEG